MTKEQKQMWVSRDSVYGLRLWAHQPQWRGKAWFSTEGSVKLPADWLPDLKDATTLCATVTIEL